MLIEPVSCNTKTIYAASDNYPPYIDSNSPDDGLLMEIIRAAYNTQGYSVELDYVPWARAFSGVLNGTYDILPDVYYNESRALDLQFSTPLTINDIRIISNVDDKFNFTHTEDLTGKDVGVIRGYFYSKEFNEASNFTKVESSGFIQNIYRMLNGRIDLTIEDKLVARTLLFEENPALLEKFIFSESSVTSNKLYIACPFSNKRYVEIIGAFNTGLEIIKTNGIYSEIIEKYNTE